MPITEGGELEILLKEGTRKWVEDGWEFGLCHGTQLISGKHIAGTIQWRALFHKGGADIIGKSCETPEETIKLLLEDMEIHAPGLEFTKRNTRSFPVHIGSWVNGR